MKKKKELKFYVTTKRNNQSLQLKEQGFLTTSTQVNLEPKPHYHTSRPSRTKTTKILQKKINLTSKRHVMHLFTNQNKQHQVQLQNKDSPETVLKPVLFFLNIWNPQLLSNWTFKWFSTLLYKPRF